MRACLFTCLLLTLLCGPTDATAADAPLQCGSPSCGYGNSDGPKRIIRILKELPKAGQNRRFLIQVYRYIDGKMLGDWNVEIPFMAVTQTAIELHCGRCSKLLPGKAPDSGLVDFYYNVWSSIPAESASI